MKSKKTTRVLVVLTILFVICTGVHADPPGWKIIQVTDNGTADQYPRISGSNVVWIGGGIGSESEIFFWDGSTTIQITDDGITDHSAQISDSNVVWQSGVGSDSDIFFWDGVSTTQITDNNTWDIKPQISGSNVCWLGEDGDGLMQVFFWDGRTTQVTHGDSGSVTPQISGSTVVWVGEWTTETGTDWEVLLWSGSAIFNISNDNGVEERPLISDGNKAWLGYDDSYKRQIHLRTDSGKFVTDNEYEAYHHQMSGSNVVWWAYDGGSLEIYFWSGGPTTKISGDNGYDNKYPQISCSNIVWEATDIPGNQNDTDIFFWDPNSGATRLTENDHQDIRPQISGSIVAWHGQTNPGSDHEIFVAIKCSAPPTADVSGNCKVDFVDFAMLAEDWQDTTNFEDLGDMASQWLTCGYDIQSFCWE